MKREEVVIIGAGPGGLAVAAELRRRGVPAIILERSDGVGAQWRRQYRRLSLNTVRWSAHLPGMRLPRALGRWPSRDDLVIYLEEYAERNQLDIRFGVEVETVERRIGGWRLLTSEGALDAAEIVVATGSCNTPAVPAWPGLDTFTGEFAHSTGYRGAPHYSGRDVLVIGAGNSGAEIAADLAAGGAGSVSLSVRTPPNLLPRWAFFVPPELFSRVFSWLPERLVDGSAAIARRLLVGDLGRYGLPAPERGFYETLLHSRVTPIIDIGLVAELRRGAVSVMPAVEGFDEGEVLLAGGARIAPEAVIAATGYDRALEALVGSLDVLEADGMPRANGAETPAGAPGLYFIGFAHPSGSSLRELRIDARRLARALARSRRRLVSGSERVELACG